MTKQFKEAQDIANSLEEQIKIVDNELSYPQILKLAIYTAECMKAVAPMYAGNLKPSWKKYYTVIQILKDRLNGDNTDAKILSDYSKIKQFVDDLEQGAYVLHQPLRFKTGIEDADQIKHLEQMVKDGILKKRYKLYCINCDKEGEFLFDEGEDIEEQCSECDGAFDETYQVTTHYKKT